jgi:hypothetical protein
MYYDKIYINSHGHFIQNGDFLDSRKHFQTLSPSVTVDDKVILSSH